MSDYSSCIDVMSCDNLDDRKIEQVKGLMFKTICVIALCMLVPAVGIAGDQVRIKCHITCRCLTDNSVGNFEFVIPIDRSPDIGFEADLACKAYGNRVCSDGCNGSKFSYTYQVTGP